MKKRQEIHYNKIKSIKDRKYKELNDAIEKGDALLEEKLRKECVNLDIKCNKLYMYYTINENYISINIEDKKNTVSSFLLSIISLILMIELLIVSDSVYSVFSILIFGIFEFLTLLIDSFYHSLKKRYKIKKKFKAITDGLKGIRILSTFGILPLIVLRNEIGIMLFMVSFLFSVLYMIMSLTTWLKTNNVIKKTLIGFIYVVSLIAFPILIKNSLISVFLIIISEMVILFGNIMDNRRNTEDSHLIYHILYGISLILFSIAILHI